MPTANVGNVYLLVVAMLSVRERGAPALFAFIRSTAKFYSAVKSISLKPNWPTKIRPDSLLGRGVLPCASSVADYTVQEDILLLSARQYLGRRTRVNDSRLSSLSCHSGNLTARVNVPVDRRKEAFLAA